MAVPQSTNEIYFHLIKLVFNSIDISNYNPIIKVKKIASLRELIVSCFESERNYIICLYHNILSHLKVIVFDENLNELKNKTILKN